MDALSVEHDNALHRMLHRQESAHGLGIHSEGEQDDFSDDEGNQSTLLQVGSHRHHHHDAEKRSVSEERDISKSTISFGSARDKKTVAEKLQAAFGYPELEDFIGGE
jgi:hypothetical protein